MPQVLETILIWRKIMPTCIQLTDSQISKRMQKCQLSIAQRLTDLFEPCKFKEVSLVSRAREAKVLAVES